MSSESWRTPPRVYILYFITNSVFCQYDSGDFFTFCSFLSQKCRAARWDSPFIISVSAYFLTASFIISASFMRLPLCRIIASYTLLTSIATSTTNAARISTAITP